MSSSHCSFLGGEVERRMYRSRDGHRLNPKFGLDFAQFGHLNQGFANTPSEHSLSLSAWFSSGSGLACPRHFQVAC